MVISCKILHLQTLYLVLRYDTKKKHLMTKVTDVEVHAFSKCFFWIESKIWIDIDFKTKITHKWNQAKWNSKMVQKIFFFYFLHLHEIVEGLYFHCSLSVCLSVCLCVCVSVCPDFLWTKFQPNGCTNLYAVFAKWLLTTLARTLLKLVTLGQRSRSRWPKMYVILMKKIRQKFRFHHSIGNFIAVILIPNMTILQNR